MLSTNIKHNFIAV